MKKILENIKKIKNVMPIQLRWHLIFLYIALIIAALLEMVGLGSIPIFISLLLDPTGTKEFFGINMSFLFNNINIFENTAISFGILIIAIFLFKTIFLFLTYLLELLFLKKLKIHFSKTLLKVYMFKPYLFFVNKNSANLSRNLIVETDNAVGFVRSIINFSRELSILIIIFSLLISFDPIISISAFVILAIFGTVFYLGTEKFLEVIRVSRFTSLGELFKGLHASFGAIKDLKIYKKENYFVKKFENEKKTYEHFILLSDLIVKSPRLIFELTGVILVISVAVSFIYLNEDVASLFPILALIAISTIRLMPSFSQISHSLAYLKLWKNSFELVADEVLAHQSNKLKDNFYQKIENKHDNQKVIEIENVSFVYPGDKKGVPISEISLDIMQGQIIGIIGKSGAGKSTLANIMLNLLKPSSGKIKIYKNEKSIKKDNGFIAHVAQDIFLSDDTFRRNIAFGEDDKNINDDKVFSALRDAELLDFVKNNPKGLDSIVGERGIKLSGGERQRLGIARALYKQPEILIMDEATSSLDNFTEQQVMKSINKLRRKHTIVMIAHRLSTIEICDKVYLIENGKIKDSGKLSELLERHPNLVNYKKSNDK